MTLVAVHVDADQIGILADGLSCHDKLTISLSRQIGSITVQNSVPGRTTLQKIFPHSSFAFAIVHCGSNQRDGTPIRTIVKEFWERAASKQHQPASLVKLFEETFGGNRTTETSLLVGWPAPGKPVVHVIGADCDKAGDGKYWAGSGRNSLSPCWADLDSLWESAGRFLGECQRLAPFNLPYFANCYGGHWHRLQLTESESPKWINEPIRTGIEVSAILPGRIGQACDDIPSHDITRRGEQFKEVLRRTFQVTTVRGALERLDDDEILREKVARLIAIFDEVRLDAAVATVEDAQRYSEAITQVGGLVKA